MQLYKLKLSYLCCPITFNQSASKFLRHNFHVVFNSLYSFFIYKFYIFGSKHIVKHRQLLTLKEVLFQKFR